MAVALQMHEGVNAFNLVFVCFHVCSTTADIDDIFLDVTKLVD